MSRKTVDIDAALDALYDCNGNLIKCLERIAGTDHEAQATALFQITYQLAAEEMAENKQEWETLIDVGIAITAQQIEALTLDCARKGESKDPKAILERLIPERWARKSIAKPKAKEQGNPFEDAVNSYPKGDK